MLGPLSHQRVSPIAIIFAVLFLLMAPSTSAAIPISTVVNGDWEAGTAGWTAGTNSPGPNLIPGCDGTGNMALFYNQYSGNILSQPVITAPWAQVLAIEFDARIDTMPTNAAIMSSNSIQVLANHVATGAGERMLHIGFLAGNRMSLMASSSIGTNTDATFGAVAPTDGQCHHYLAMVVRAQDPTEIHAYLFIDGTLVLHDQGTNAVSLPDKMIVGDTAGNEAGGPPRGPAPDVAYDNIRYGAWA